MTKPPCDHDHSSPASSCAGIGLAAAFDRAAGAAVGEEEPDILCDVGDDALLAEIADCVGNTARSRGRSTLAPVHGPAGTGSGLDRKVHFSEKCTFPLFLAATASKPFSTLDDPVVAAIGGEEDGDVVGVDVVHAKEVSS